MNLKKKLSPIFTTLFIAAFIIYFLANRTSFKPLLDVSALSLFLIAFTKLFTYLVNGLFMQWTVEVFTGKFRLIEAIYIAILSAIGNFFGPLLGGATIRAVYLKKVHKLSYSFFTSTLAGYYVILFAANSILALISLLFLRETRYRNGLMLFFGLWLLAMLGMMFISLPRRERLAKLESRRLPKFIITVLYDIEEGWRRITTRKLLLAKLSTLSVSGFAITFITTLIEFHAIHAHISPAGLGLYTAISSTAILISLTPGSIGIRESLLLITSSVMGVSNSQILQVAVIDRGVTFLLLGLLYLATKVLRPKSSTKLQQNPES